MLSSYLNFKAMLYHLILFAFSASFSFFFSGLDVPGVALVVNMSVGMTVADYVHRCVVPTSFLLHLLYSRE